MRNGRVVLLAVSLVFSLMVFAGCGGGGGGGTTATNTPTNQNQNPPPATGQAPQFVSVDPVDGATGVALDKTIVYTFDKDLGTVTPAMFPVAKLDGTAIEVTVVSAGKQAMVSPKSGQWPASMYLSTKYVGVPDSAGNVSDSKTSHFTTAAAVTSGITTNIADGATGIPIDAVLVVTFPAEIDVMSPVTLVLTQDGVADIPLLTSTVGKSMIARPNVSALAADSNFTWKIKGAHYTNGQSQTGEVVKRFTTNSIGGMLRISDFHLYSKTQYNGDLVGTLRGVSKLQVLATGAIGDVSVYHSNFKVEEGAVYEGNFLCDAAPEDTIEVELRASVNGTSYAKTTVSCTEGLVRFALPAATGSNPAGEFAINAGDNMGMYYFGPVLIYKK